MTCTWKFEHSKKELKYTVLDTRRWFNYLYLVFLYLIFRESQFQLRYVSFEGWSCLGRHFKVDMKIALYIDKEVLGHLGRHWRLHLKSTENYYDI